MPNFTPLLPGFHLQTLRRRPRSAQQKLADTLAHLKQKSFSQLGACLGQFIPSHSLRPTETGALSRRRVFSKANTFWAFFSQVLDADGGCQEVVRKLQAFAAMKAKPLPSSRPRRLIAKHGKSLLCPAWRPSSSLSRNGFRPWLTPVD